MITRRTFLGGSLASVAAACGPRTRKPSGPQITHGVQAGDPEVGRALVWSRCSEPARMIVEWDTTERFANPRRVAGEVVTPARDQCGTVELTGLPDAQTIVYRVRFEREAARGASTWVTGKLRTPRADKLRVAWTGDTCGQGFGRSKDFGGLRGYAALRNAQPDVFINSGDLIYADNPIEAELELSDGRVWKNITNERVARVSQELDDFRARFAYNLEDDHLRACAAEVPVIAQWDDHETHNDWFPGQQLADDRFDKQRDASKLAAMARQAMSEWVPLRAGPIHRVLHHGPLLDVFVLDCRSFRSPNGANNGDDIMLGGPQITWLLDALTASKARWKIIACDQPISLLITDGAIHEGFANGDPGPPSGRERELAQLVTTMRERAIRNTVWVTADVHYAAAHHFDPKRAAEGLAFDPFWEFIAGPIHAGNFGPNELDATLGPAVKFQWGTPPPDTEMLSPLDGKQSFGTLDATTDALVVRLHDIDGHELYKLDITPA